MKQKIKVVGLVIVTVATMIISAIYGISLTTKNGGMLLLPFLYIELVYTIPHIFKWIFKDFRSNFCITKDDYQTRCFEEATGKEIEKLEITLKGEEV